MTLTETFDNSIEAAELTDAHATARELARKLCELADIAFERRRTDEFLKIEKQLHALLNDLGATKAASAIKKQTEGGVAANDTNSAANTFAQLRASFN
jgi:hypothetical protein